MAELRTGSGSLRFIVSVVAVATTLGGTLAMAVHDGAQGAPPAVALTAPAAAPAPLPGLQPIPSLEPIPSLPALAPLPARGRPLAAAPAARPVALATTQSSR
jgi:hypothetical protein